MSDRRSKRYIGHVVGSGRTSDVHAYGRFDVVKLLRPSVPARWAAVEFEIASMVANLGLRVPEPKGLVEIDGRPGIVFARVDGMSLWDVAVAEAMGGEALGARLAEVHREILDCRAPLGLSTFKARITEKLGGSRLLDGTDRIEVAEMVDDLPSGRSLLHGDLHPGNILMGTDGLFVIDWFDGCCGDALADVARSSILVRPTIGRSPAHLPGARPSLLAATQHAYRSAMADALGPLDPAAPVSRWEAVIAASRLAEAADDEASLFAIWNARS